MNIVDSAITELTRSMQLAADREEYQSAGDMQRIRRFLENNSQKTFTLKDIEHLKESILKIVNNKDIEYVFDKILRTPL